MKVYSIIHNNTELDRSGELNQVILEEFDMICSEYDDGIYFIRSEASAPEILNKLQNVFETRLGEIIYVIEVGADFAAQGTTKTIRAVEEAL